MHPQNGLSDRTQQLGFENELALLVLLTRLIGLVIFPTDRGLALFADDVAHDMASRRHVALHGFGGVNVDDGGEEEGFAVLAAEVAADDVVEVGEVGFAALECKG